MQLINIRLGLHNANLWDLCSKLITHTTILWPFFRDHRVSQCQKITSGLYGADTQTILLGATPSGLTSAHLHHPTLITQYR